MNSSESPPIEQRRVNLNPTLALSITSLQEQAHHSMMTPNNAFEVQDQGDSTVLDDFDSRPLQLSLCRTLNKASRVFICSI